MSRHRGDDAAQRGATPELRALQREERRLRGERRVVRLMVATVVLLVIPPLAFVASIVTLRAARRTGSRWTQWAAYLVVGTGAVAAVAVTAVITGGT